MPERQNLLPNEPLHELLESIPSPRPRLEKWSARGTVIMNVLTESLVIA